MKISLVVPVFNEEDTIPIFYQSIRRELTQYEVQIVFINDGSTDNSEAIINALAVADQNVMALSFTRNFGKEPALIAGLEHATGEVVIPMDVDLQDPISVIPLMMEKWRAGADMVLAKRIDRQVDSHLKRKTAQWFYRIHNKISSPRIEENVGDFRLMSRKIVEDIKRMPERNLFMKGVLSWVGGNVDIVEYVRAERVAGASKFNGWKLWNLAIEGITSFSTFPLRIWAYIGLTVAAMSFLYGSWLAIITIFFGNPVHGYTSLIVSILFLGGIQLIGIGVLGEYIGRIYIGTKQRPRYILKK